MFSNKKKIEFNDEERRVVLLSLNNFRNDLIKEKRYTDIFDELIPKLKTKMKVDKYELGAIITALTKNREEIVKLNQDTSIINELLLRLIDINEHIK